MDMMDADWRGRRGTRMELHHCLLDSVFKKLGVQTPVPRGKKKNDTGRIEGRVSLFFKEE
jgi:hypothetical protein